MKLFERTIMGSLESFKPAVLLATGIAPLTRSFLARVRSLGLYTVCFLTDDPWNPKNGAGFFWHALREYDLVCTPRRLTIEDLYRHGCRRVEPLHFGYSPDVHFRETASNEDEKKRFSCDVAIIGGGDEDRFPLAVALSRARLKLRLYGGYWDRVAELRSYHCGFARGRDYRLATAGALVHIGMVRRANRDGHSMRSYEIPAMGGCLVAEDTEDHRQILGPEGEAALYYRDVKDLVEKTCWLVKHPEKAKMMGQRAMERVTKGDNTYADRLCTILKYVEQDKKTIVHSQEPFIRKGEAGHH